MKSSPIGIKSIFMVVLVLTLLTPITVFAQSPLYIAIKPGIYSPKAGDLDGFDTGFSGEVDFGYRVNPNLAAEIGLGYFHTKGEKTVGGATYVGREFDIDVFPVTFTLKAILPYKRWEFFGLGGVGLILFLADMMMRIMTMIIMIMTMIIITIRYWGAIWEQGSITI